MRTDIVADRRRVRVIHDDDNRAKCGVLFSGLEHPFLRGRCAGTTLPAKMNGFGISGGPLAEQRTVRYRFAVVTFACCRPAPTAYALAPRVRLARRL